MRADLMAEQADRREIVDYLLRDPEIRKSGKMFEDLARERFHSIVYRVAQRCNIDGVGSVHDPRFGEIYAEIESMYPTLPEIADAVVKGKIIVMPDGYTGS